MGTITAHVDADFADLIPDYLAHRRQDVQLLKEALAQGDFATLRTLGHKMKGTGGGYGFPDISDIGRAIQAAAENQESAIIGEQTERLARYLAEVTVIVD